MATKKKTKKAAPKTKKAAPKTKKAAAKKAAPKKAPPPPRPPRAPGERRYWLMKSEPTSFSWDQLVEAKRTGWDGVRNYMARNFLRDEIKLEDGVLYYHSSCEVPAVIGTAKVVREGYADPTQWVKGHEHEDPGSPPNEPRWYQVDIEAVQRFAEPITLERLKATPGLGQMLVTKRGQRLSVQPVLPEEWAIVLSLAGLD